jgi:hypothetical protein
MGASFGALSTMPFERDAIRIVAGEDVRWPLMGREDLVGEGAPCSKSCNRRPQVFLRHKRTALFLTTALRFRVVLI